MKNKTKTNNDNKIYEKIDNVLSYIILVLSLASPVLCGGFDFIYTLAFCFVLLLCICFKISYKREKIYSKYIYYASFAVIVSELIITVFSPNIYLSLEQIILFATGILLIQTSSEIFRNRKYIILFAVILTGISSLISIWILRNTAINSGGGELFWSELITGKVDRIFGTFINPNFYAGYLSMCLPVSIGLCFVFRETKYSVLWGTLTVFSIINLCLTGSKFGFVSLFVSVLSMIVYLTATKSVNKNNIKKVIIFSAVFILFFALFSGTLLSRIETAGSTQVHSAAFRIATWRAAVSIIQKNPLIGVFPGRFSEVFPQYNTASLTKHAHSSYLQFASECGIIISVLCLIGLFIVFRAFWTKKELNEKTFDFIESKEINFLYSGFLGAFVSAISHNLADSDLYIASHTFIFSLLCGLFLSFGKPLEKPKYLIMEYRNLTAIYILACFWIMLSVIFYQCKDYKNAYKIFPNNYLALRELAENALSPDTRMAYLLKAKDKAENDYYSYQLLGDFIAYEEPGNAKAKEYYKEALLLHPHSTLLMTKLISWAENNNDENLAEEYYKKLIQQETSPYEKLKGIPELVDTSYAEAHIYFGDKYAETDREKAITHYQSAIQRYENWLKPENMNFLIVSVITGQKSIESYENNYNNCIKTYEKLEKLENKNYTEEKNLFGGKFSNILEELNKFQINLKVLK